MTAPDFAEGGTRAWLVVAGCWCTSFTSFGIVNTFGRVLYLGLRATALTHSVYETFYREHFLSSYSPSAIAWIGSIQALAQLSIAVIGGLVMDKFGPMAVIWPFSFLLVVAMMLISLCTQFYQFILCQGVLLGVSAGLIYAPAFSVVGQYFYVKRPLAMSLASTGSPIGGIIYSVVLTKLIPEVGFPWAQRTCAFMSFFLLSIAAITIRPTGVKRKGSGLLTEAFRKPAYTLQIVAVFLVMFGLWTPYFYLADYGLAHGIDLGGYFFAFLNGGSCAGRIFAGLIANYVGQYNVVTAAIYAGGILLFCWLAIASKAGLIVLAVLYGAASGTVIALMSSTIAHTADHPSQIPTYMGQALFIIGFAGLAGTPVTGALITQSFSHGIIFSGAIVMAGAVFMTAARWFYAKDKLVA